MLFGKNTISDQTKQSLKIGVDNVTIDWVSDYQYLGIFLDESFQKHIEYRSNSIKRKLNLFGKIRSYLTCNIAVILYKILSYFDVGDIFYNSACKNSLTKLQTLQNKPCAVFTLMINN